jgi:hypothetical protein
VAAEAWGWTGAAEEPFDQDWVCQALAVEEYQNGVPCPCPHAWVRDLGKEVAAEDWEVAAEDCYR